jgi:TrmH family RNA methyltransferase
MIRSPQNSKVKQIRRLLAHRRDRTKERLFVIEGTRWLDEYITANRSPHYIMATTSWLAEPAHATRLSRLQSPVFEIDEQLLNEVADTDSPPGILAVVPIEPVPVPSNLTFVLILDAIRTPGNLGTILRTAGAAGVDALLMAPGCVDPYNPKVVRSSMGAHLRVPLRQAGWADISRLCQGLTVWLAEGIGQQF